MNSRPDHNAVATHATDHAAGRDGGSGAGGLLQVLGVAFGLAVIIGNTIGVGILRTPGEVAAQIPDRTWILALWLAGGLYALLGALSLAELGAMIPRSGGQYVFVRRALGPFPAFVVGWSDWISCCGSIAVTGLVMAEYLAALAPPAARWEVPVAAGVVLAFCALEMIGIRAGDWAQRLTSLLKALLLMALTAACFILSPDAPDAAPASAAEATLSATATSLPAGAAPAITLLAVVIALQSVIYAYDGWSGVIYFGQEVRDPGRTVPRSMLTGVASVTAIYLLLNLALLRWIDPQQMSGDKLPVATAATLLLGAWGDPILRVAVLASLLSTMNALQLMTSRVPVAMSADGLLPRWVGRVSTSGAPRVSLGLNALLALLLMFSGSLTAVLALSAFFFVFNYLLSFTSVFVLRRREPATERPYRAWGYPWTTALAWLGSAAFLASAMLDWANARWALAVLAGAGPAYLVIRAIGGAARTGRPGA